MMKSLCVLNLINVACLQFLFYYFIIFYYCIFKNCIFTVDLGVEVCPAPQRFEKQAVDMHWERHDLGSTSQSRVMRIFFSECKMDQAKQLRVRVGIKKMQRERKRCEIVHGRVNRCREQQSQAAVLRSHLRFVIKLEYDTSHPPYAFVVIQSLLAA